MYVAADFFDDRGDGLPAPPDAVDRVVEVADMMSIFAAQRLERVAALHDEAVADAHRGGRQTSEILERSIRLELACALRVTEHAAGRLIALADAVVHRYPRILDSLAQARVTDGHVEVLVSAVDSVEPEFRDEVLSRGLEMAEAQPVGSFRRALGKLVESVRATTLVERHENALKTRRIAVEQGHDGMAWLGVFAPAVEVHAIHGRVTAIAKVLAAAGGETRTLDQLRADVFTDLLIDGSTTDQPAESRGIRASVVVTVPVLSLLSDDTSMTEGCDPAVVEGLGPISPSRARELCGGAKDWMRVLTHPETGMVLSVGRESYRPPASLRRLVKWRADRCMAPGCGMPAARCQIDHSIAWEHGGSTSLKNLAPFCQGHHTVKHHGGWIVRQIEGSGGAIEWISPAGRRYIVEPERRVPVFRSSGPPDIGAVPF